MPSLKLFNMVAPLIRECMLAFPRDIVKYTLVGINAANNMVHIPYSSIQLNGSIMLAY